MRQKCGSAVAMMRVVCVPRLFVRLAVALAGLCLAATASLAECSPSSATTTTMRFLVAQGGGESGGDHWIAAEGRIDAEAAARFTRLLATLDTVPDVVVLSSPGGRLDAGLALGRAIRTAGLATRVGDTEDCEDDDARVTTGLCASACAYAFLGGVTRHVGQGNYIGYHALYPAAGQAPVDAETLQRATARATARVQDYVRAMGANPVLTEIAARVVRDDLFLPDGPVRAALGIETGAPAMAGISLAAPTPL